MTRRRFVTVTKPDRRVPAAKPSSEWLPRERIEPMPRGKPNPITFAQFWLGERLQERGDVFLLDGQPTRLDEIMLMANRIARSNGQDMVTACDRWIPA